MFKPINHKIYWLIGIGLVLVLAVMVKGCDREHAAQKPTSPENAQPKEISLTITKPPNPQAKALTYWIEAVGLDQNDQEIWPHLGPMVIDNPTFPLATPFTVYVPLPVHDRGDAGTGAGAGTERRGGCVSAVGDRPDDPHV